MGIGDDMKKGLKLISLIVVLVMLAALFVGCDLFKLNEERYRSQELLTLPKGTVTTLGELIDFMDNNASSYLGNSQYDKQEVWDYFYSLYINQMLIADDYINSNITKLNNSAEASLYKYGKYLSNEDILYYYNNILLSMFSTLDSEVEAALTEKGFTFDTAPTKPKPVKETEIKEDSIYKGSLAKDLTAINEALTKYETMVLPTTSDFDLGYIFEVGSEKLIKKVSELNKRISSDSDKKVLTQQDYISAQTSTLASLKRNVNIKYSVTLQQYIINQLQQMFVQEMVNQWTLIRYKELYDSITVTNGPLEEYLQALIQAQQEKYSLDPTSFASFATTVSETSFILSIPQIYEGRYAEVSNIVLPFNSEQTAQLAAWKKLNLSTEEYNKLRENLALQIVAQDFYSELNEDNEFSDVVDFKQMFINYLDEANNYAKRSTYFAGNEILDNYIALDFINNNGDYAVSFETYVKSDAVYKSGTLLSQFVNSNDAIRKAFNEYLTDKGQASSAASMLEFIDSNENYIKLYTNYLKENKSHDFVLSSTVSGLTAKYNEYIADNWAASSLKYIESDKQVKKNYNDWLFNNHTAQQETSFINSNASVAYAFSKFNGSATQFINLVGLNNQTYFQYLYHIYLVDTYEGQANSNINNATFMEFFNDCLYRYNTDQGGYNKAYGYVIDKFILNTGYVPEFSQTAMEIANGSVGGYDFVVTDYGIHIIMKTSDLTVDTFTDKSFGSGAGTNYYRLLKTYFDAVKAEVVDKQAIKLYNDNIDNVVINKSVLKMFADILGVSIEKKTEEE